MRQAERLTQEKLLFSQYMSMMAMHFRGSAAAIVVYDITSDESFQYMKNWVREITKFEPNAKLVVAGNKCDLEEERKVSKISAFFRRL